MLSDFHKSAKRHYYFPFLKNPTTVAVSTGQLWWFLWVPVQDSSPAGCFFNSQYALGPPVLGFPWIPTAPCCRCCWGWVVYLLKSNQSCCYTFTLVLLLGDPRYTREILLHSGCLYACWCRDGWHGIYIATQNGHFWVTWNDMDWLINGSFEGSLHKK